MLSVVVRHASLWCPSGSPAPACASRSIGGASRLLPHLWSPAGLLSPQGNYYFQSADPRTFESCAWKQSGRNDPSSSPPGYIGLLHPSHAQLGMYRESDGMVVFIAGLDALAWLLQHCNDRAQCMQLHGLHASPARDLDLGDPDPFVHDVRIDVTPSRQLYDQHSPPVLQRIRPWHFFALQKALLMVTLIVEPADLVYLHYINVDPLLTSGLREYVEKDNKTSAQYMRLRIQDKIQFRLRIWNWLFMTCFAALNGLFTGVFLKALNK